ncbi:MAG: diguanylate cyclase [Chloroflexota bacterium]|nr:diguanylate cyclase [Chloroflexota bacterium]
MHSPARFLGALSLGALAAIAGLTWHLAGAMPASLALATGFAGIVGGASAQRLIHGRHVSWLQRAMESLAAGEGQPEAHRLGHLTSVTPQLHRLTEALETAREAATTDRLTRVANRPTLLAHLFQEVERATRYGRPLSVAFMDLDHFKIVNDTYGHSVGDEVLRAVADTFRSNTRESDFIGRYGGEEFVLILPETGVDEATNVVEKLRHLILKLRVPSGSGEDLAVSISIGLAGGHGTNLHVDEMLRDADAAMYSAKSLGRNQTYVFAEIDDESARIPRSPISAEARARAAEVGDLGRQAAEAALAAIIDPMPHYRGKPSSLIAGIAVGMARHLELPEQEVERIRVASLLHDIGKIGVPAQILEKPGPLSPDEWQAVVQHPRIGQVIIDRVAAVRDAGAIILHHHERFSGHGYPHGLRGGDIPLGARIVAIADAYDAMVHDRPYQRAVSHHAAIAELRKHAGIQFDPELVEIFCSLFRATVPRPDPSLLVTAPQSLVDVVHDHDPDHGHVHGSAASA